MGSFIGIDLGTTFSALARIDESGRSVIVHVNGANLTPSCVAIVDSKTVEVGTEQAQKKRLAWMKVMPRAASSEKWELRKFISLRANDSLPLT